MKILLTTPTYPPFNSGLGNAVQSQARILLNAGHSVEIATGGKRTQSRFDDALGIKVHEFNIQGAQSLLHPIKGDVQPYKNFLKTYKCDLWILNAWQTWSTDIPLSMLGQIYGKKLIFSHGTSVNLFIKSDFFRSMIRYVLWRPYWWRMKDVLKKLDGIIFLSDSDFDSRSDDLKMARELAIPFSVVPNALSEIAYQKLEANPLNFSSRNGFISVGSYDWAKGHDFVIRSYAKSRFKNLVPLRIFGQKYNDYTNSLRSLAFRLGLRDDMVTFYEGISGEELLKHYSSSSLFLCGSHTECQPLVLIDAMATGTPFIARASGCIPSMAGGISVFSEIECTNQINHLMNNNQEWERYAKAGREEALARYQPIKVSNYFLAAIDAINDD